MTVVTCLQFDFLVSGLLTYMDCVHSKRWIS